MLNMTEFPEWCEKYQTMSMNMNIAPLDNEMNL